MLHHLAMGVDNPDRSPVAINGCDPAQTPTGFAQIVSDDLPVLHTWVRCAFTDYSPPFAVQICSVQAGRSLSVGQQKALQFASADAWQSLGSPFAVLQSSLR